MLISDLISGDRNVIKKEVEKILKYKEITIEIQSTWNVKAEMIFIYLLIYLFTYSLTYLYIYFTFLPHCQRPSFTPIQNNRQSHSSV